MGAKQSTFQVAPQHFHAPNKNKTSLFLEKSRASYLSEHLTASSETNLDTIGTDATTKGQILRHKLRLGITKPPPEAITKQPSVTVTKTKAVSNDAQHGVMLAEEEDSNLEDSVEPEMVVVMRFPQQNSQKPPVVLTDVIKNDGVKKGRRTFKPLGRYDRSSSFHDAVDHKASKVRPENFHFAFDNLVFEGGGNKGLAYCGAVRYLEEIGVMDKVKSIAGASAGGMFAGLVAVGYNSYQIEDFLSERIDKIFLDASCGYCSLLPNLYRSFGWNPGRRIYEWFGERMKAKTGEADFTFQQLYQKHGMKLCIIVTNLNQMTTEYCHPKTTPDMPIRTALRMSMAIPGLFSAMKYKHHGTEDVYVDGGVLCNYPIHCFDGWYLSMKPEDSFMRRLQPLRDIPLIMERNNRFGDYNDNTLGMLLYSDAEEDILRINLERRVGCLNPPKPETETKLYIQRQKEAKMKQRAEREHAKVVQAVDSFLRVLKKHNIDRNDVIDRQELEAAFQDEKEFPRDQAEVLFGKDFTVTQAFEILDRDDNGRIRYDELVRFIEENGVSLQSRFLGYERKEIKNFMTFLGTLQSCLIFNVKRLYVEERDLERTVGINTGHIHTTDFVLEEPDRDFVVQRGYNSMMAFLKYYVANHPDKVRRKMGDRLTVPDISELPETTTPSTTPTPDGEETPLLGEAASERYIANCEPNNGLDVVDSDDSTLSRRVEGQTATEVVQHADTCSTQGYTDAQMNVDRVKYTREA